METIDRQSVAASIDVNVLRAYVQRVYAWMGGGLLITAVVAYAVSNSEPVMSAIYGTPLRWLFLFAPLGMVFYLSSRIDKMQPSTAAGMFIAFATLMGVSISYIFLVYEMGSIFQVFMIASGMYAGAAVYGYTTKRDLTSMGSFLFMGLIGLVIAVVVNMFMQSDMMSFIISVIGVLIFTGLTAWDMQKIKSQAVVMFAGEGLATKRAIVGALSLYLNFLNLFLFLLRLLGDRR